LFAHPAFKVAALAFLWALAHHLFAGVRHLLIDIDIGSRLPVARRSAWSVNLGVGPRGLNINISPRGVRQTVGLPETGLYYQESQQWPKSSDVAPTAASQEESNSELGWKIIGIALAFIAQ